jgi:MOSC domain-containing protein YiiM/ferredoxin-NADP reductase
MSVQGETVVTGFVKQPTEASRRIEVGGLIGDDHVDDAEDLDRAVLFYQRQHYTYWSQELERELSPGMFGEQMTIDGPLEHEILVGDQLQIGGTLLEVTQPRIPCRKMALRLQDQDMPTRYMRSGHTGFFCKVLQPGEVRAGDSVELVQHGPDGLSLAELATVLHSDEPEPEKLDTILSCSVLPDRIRAKLTRLADRMAANAQSWSGDRPLLVSAREQHGSEVVALDLTDADGERLPDFEAGQFLTLVLDVPGVDRRVVRTYTIAGRSADGAGYRIAVKREPAPSGSVDVPPGVASGHLHDNATIGTSVTARAPRGRFVLSPGGAPVVLVSAGIGITPMLAMLEQVAVASPPCSTTASAPHREVFFVHVARSSRELAFGRHVRDLVAGKPHLHSHLLFSKPRADDLRGRDFDAEGRLTPQKLRRSCRGSTMISRPSTTCAGLLRSWPTSPPDCSSAEPLNPTSTTSSSVPPLPCSAAAMRAKMPDLLR